MMVLYNVLNDVNINHDIALSEKTRVNLSGRVFDSILRYSQ